MNCIYFIILACKKAEEDAETQPNILVACDTCNNTFSTCQEDVILDTTICIQLVVLSETVDCHPNGETNSAA